MIASFRSRDLKRFFERNDASGIRPDWVAKVKRHLDKLAAAGLPEDLDVPGTGFHALSGNLAGRYSLTVSANWRLTFGWSGADATDLDLEDYHGS